MTTMPDAIGQLPVDPRRKLPIPYMNMNDDGTADFLITKANRVIDCLMNSKCGICAEPLEWWSAFVGGPVSGKTHTYTNPPYHPECAKWAMRVCPFIVMPNYQRASDHRVTEQGGITPQGMTLDRPEHWHMGISRTDRTSVYQSGGAIHIIAGPWKQEFVYRYDENGKLVYPANG